MKSRLRTAVATGVLAGLAAVPAAHATNGYFAIGYGAKSMGVAGAGVATAQDTLVGSVNPAGFANLEKSFDVGIRFFSPIRKGAIDCRSAQAPFGNQCDRVVSDTSRRDLFAIPNFGYKGDINEKMDWGVSVYGNGGLNTTYDRNLYNEAAARIVGTTPVPGLGPGIPPGVDVPASATGGTLGVDLAQLIIAPSLSYKVGEGHALGIAPLIGYQKFSARGLGLFGQFGFSSDPNNLTDRGSDTALGVGLRLGYQGNVSDMVSLGVSYSSKVYMDEFDKYRGLFAEGGDFDIPATLSFGIAVQATPKLQILADGQRIFYGDVKALNNKGPTAQEFGAAFGPGVPTARQLGRKDGFGFGWDDIWVLHLGGVYKHNEQWTLRAGYNYGEVPFDSNQALFNILAPAVIEHHVTFGVSYAMDQNNEFNFAYMHGFENDLSDRNSPFFGSGASMEMYQNSLDFSYTRRF